jgi:hypothetical protein
MSSPVADFKAYIAPLFPSNAQIEDDGFNRIRIKYPIDMPLAGRRYSKAIALHFDNSVVLEFNTSNNIRKNEIGRALQDFLRLKMRSYDAYGDQTTAYQIQINDRICDRN